MLVIIAKSDLSWPKCSLINLILQMKKIFEEIWWIFQFSKRLKAELTQTRVFHRCTPGCVLFGTKQDILQIERAFSLNLCQSLCTKAVSPMRLCWGDTGHAQEDQKRRSQPNITVQGEGRWNGNPQDTHREYTLLNSSEMNPWKWQGEIWTVYMTSKINPEGRRVYIQETNHLQKLNIHLVLGKQHLRLC